MANNYNEFVVTIDTRQLNNAIKRCSAIYENLKGLFNAYRHKDNILVVTQNTYYFKLLDKDTLNGIQVCISPKTMNLEIYLIHKNKKNINNINTNNIIKTSDDIMTYFQNVIHYRFTIQERLDYIYNYLITNGQIYTNFTITRKNNIIDILQTGTNNGYYIYFNAQSFANIGNICNGEYFNVNAVTVLSVEEINEVLHNLMCTKSHTVNYYNIIDTKYLDCDMSEYINCNTTNVTNAFSDDDTDPN